MPVVYVDVVWLVNLIMDTVLLATTGYVTKRPLRWKRLLLGGLIGASYALLLFIPPLAALTTWPGKAVVSLVMVWVGLPCASWRDLLRASVLFYFVSFVFAGAAIAMHYAIPGTTVGDGTVIAGNQFAFVQSMGGLALVVAVPAAAMSLGYFWRRVRTVKTQANSLYSVQVTVGENVVSFTGLMDTGNQLRDPLSGKAVCLLDSNLWLQLIPADLRESVESSGDVFSALADWAGSPKGPRFAVIPFRGAGAVAGTVIGLLPDRVALSRNGQTQVLEKPCFFALHQGRLAQDGSFQAILHTEIISGDDNFELEVTASAAHSETSDSTTTPLD